MESSAKFSEIAQSSLADDLVFSVAILVVALQEVNLEKQVFLDDTVLLARLVFVLFGNRRRFWVPSKVASRLRIRRLKSICQVFETDS